MLYIKEPVQRSDPADECFVDVKHKLVMMVRLITGSRELVKPTFRLGIESTKANVVVGAFKVNALSNP